jgi:hypothetical protein
MPLRATEIMGLPADASHDEVRQRYKYLARVLHPDKSGSKALFQLVAQAYDVMTGAAEAAESPPTRRKPGRAAHERAAHERAAHERAAHERAAHERAAHETAERVVRPPRPFETVPDTVVQPRVDHSWSQPRAVPRSPARSKHTKVGKKSADLAARVAERLAQRSAAPSVVPSGAADIKAPVPTSVVDVIATPSTLPRYPRSTRPTSPILFF